MKFQWKVGAIYASALLLLIHSGSPWLVLSMNNALDLVGGWNPFHQSCKSFILESNENDHLSRYPTYIYWISYNIDSDVYVLSSRHVVEYLRYKLGIEPTPPSLEVKVLTAGPPEKSLLHILNATAFCNGGNGIPRTWVTCVLIRGISRTIVYSVSTYCVPGTLDLLLWSSQLHEEGLSTGETESDHQETCPDSHSYEGTEVLL